MLGMTFHKLEICIIHRFCVYICFILSCINMWNVEGIEQISTLLLYWHSMYTCLYMRMKWKNAFEYDVLHYCHVVVVDCGLTSHSAIFQLYSDGTDVQFSKFWPAAGHPRHGQLGVFSVPSLPRHGHRDARRRLLPPCHQRAHTRWG